jgi:DNA polymerase-4
VASQVAKPDGLLEVPPEREIAFLHPLPVERLWGVGPVTSRKLRAVGLCTVGQVAELPERTLVSLLGRASGRHLHALAHNRDPRRVRVGRRRGSIGSQRAMGRRMPRSWAERDAVVVAIVDRLGQRLRGARRVCRTITLRLRFDDFTRATRSTTLSEATQRTQTILATARELFEAAMPMIEARGLTLIGVTLANLDDDGAIQLALPFARRRSQAVDGVVDQVRDRFGTSSITRAVLLGRDPGLTVPLLPD